MVNEGITPKITRSGINTRNSRSELTNADKTVLNGNISRGIKILVIRLAFPTIEDIATDVNPLLKTKYSTSIIIKGFSIDHANPGTELVYFVIISLITRFLINSIYSIKYMLKI